MRLRSGNLFRFFKYSGDRPVILAIVLTTVATTVIGIELELFEAFYALSRAHESWELDEIAVGVFNLSIALCWFLIHRSRQLAAAVRDRDRARRDAQRAARHDVLTGLPNRRAFIEHLAGASAGPRVLMMLDLDRFKGINDLHGHGCGDFVLDVAARRIEQQCGDADFVARLGGDEFAVAFATGVEAKQAERCARRILTALGRPILFQDRQLKVAASVGLAQVRARVAPRDGLHLADQALFSAKREGRGKLAWYDAELDKLARDRRLLEVELRDALGKGQITPFFQPVLDISTNRLCGFEALARWQHPTRGMVAPDVFIPIAEDAGMISDLGWSILEQSCRAARNWDPRLKLAVNFSPTQFRDSHLAGTVRKILARTGFDPRRLEIEVTENALMVDFELAARSISDLRVLGVTLALDDFGTGFSSLSNLRKLPFDRIKIDRSFVSDIRARPENQKIVAGILALANGLELSVTAEGIESSSDLDFLQGMACQLGQGYHFARPLSRNEVDWLLETKWSDLQVDFDPAGPRATPLSRTG